jgi:hypothetical protein
MVGHCFAHKIYACDGTIHREISGTTLRHKQQQFQTAAGIANMRNVFVACTCQTEGIALRIAAESPERGWMRAAGLEADSLGPAAQKVRMTGQRPRRRCSVFQ